MDAETIGRLCEDIGIQRGLVRQDKDFDSAVGAPMALQFPFAPDSDQTLTSPGGSARSLTGHELDDMSSLGDDSFVQEAFMQDVVDNPWLSDPEGYESMSPPLTPPEHRSEEFEGLEGIYRFLEECDRGQGRLG